LSLQSRLFLFFTVTVVVPIAVAGILSEHAVSSALQGRDRDRVDFAAPGISALYGERIAAMPNAVSAIGSDPTFKTDLMNGDTAGLEVVLERGLQKNAGTLSFALVADAQGRVIAQVPGAPAYLPGIASPSVQELLASTSATPAGAGRLVSKAIVPVVNGNPPTLAGTLVAGIYLDNTFAEALQDVSSVDVTIVLDGRAVASTIPVPPGSSLDWRVPVSRATGNPVAASMGGRNVDAMVVPLVQNVPSTSAALVISTPLTSETDGRALVASILVVLVLAAAGAALLGFAVARAIARPLRELAAGADAISAGHYDAQIPVRSADEVGQLARAFNDMTGRLAVQVAELHESREELKRSLTRFGETLRSTHDLDKILQVVLDTSVDALRATGGVLMVVNPEGAFAGQLTVAAARGIDTEHLVLREGEGIAGAVALTGEPVRMPAAAADALPDALPDLPGMLSDAAPGGGPDAAAGAGGQGVVAPGGGPDAAAGAGGPGVGAGADAEPSVARVARLSSAAPPECLAQPSPAEPPFRTAVWVPVFAQGRIFAVLALFDREDGGLFTPQDLDTVLSLSDQAGVAIDNVVLHEEAQRLAITDGMTGIWNHRYFQLRFDQEMDRSARFRRPFCLLLCDIDDFKVVNDTYGHLVGDSVLIELARRIRSEVRDIDVLARYGGEEFVLILPETDTDGGFRAAEKIRRRIADAPFGRDLQLAVTLSIGLACFPRAGTDQTALLRAADVALYEAKARGKDRTVIYQPTEEGWATSVG
jgi:two-component system cell cycle response regulator